MDLDQPVAMQFTGIFLELNLTNMDLVTSDEAEISIIEYLVKSNQYGFRRTMLNYMNNNVEFVKSNQYGFRL